LRIIWLSVTEHKDMFNGSNGYRSRDVDLRFGASVHPQMFGWLLWGCILGSRGEWYGSGRKWGGYML